MVPKFGPDTLEAFPANSEESLLDPVTVTQNSLSVVFDLGFLLSKLDGDFASDVEEFADVFEVTWLAAAATEQFLSDSVVFFSAFLTLGVSFDSDFFVTALDLVNFVFGLGGVVVGISSDAFFTFLSSLQFSSNFTVSFDVLS